MGNRWRQPTTALQKFPRREACVAVRISTVDPELDPDSGEAFFRNTEATTGNLSRGGMFVHSWEPLAAGRRVIVVLDMPEGGELELEGRVVWTRRRLERLAQGILEAPGFGVEFVAGSRAEQAAIQRILDAGTTAGQDGTDERTSSPRAPFSPTA